MTPDQLRAAQLVASGAAAGGGVGLIAPEMKDLLVRQARDAAGDECAAQIDQHNAKIERQLKHAEEAKTLGAKLKAADEKHAKGKGRASS